MKRPFTRHPLQGLIAATLLLFWMCVPSAAAQKGAWYLGLKGGAYTPGGELREDGFGTGSATELSYGQFITDYVALEAGVGSYETSSTDIGYFSDEEEDLLITPLTFSARGVLSSNHFELAGGAGLGAYLVQGKYAATVSGDRESDTSSDTVLGYHLMAEATFNITRSFFLTLEDRYIQTQTMQLNYSVHGQHIRQRAGLDGNLLVFSIGFRF